MTSPCRVPCQVILSPPFNAHAPRRKRPQNWAVLLLPRRTPAHFAVAGALAADDEHLFDSFGDSSSFNFLDDSFSLDGLPSDCEVWRGGPSNPPILGCITLHTVQAIRGV